MGEVLITGGAGFIGSHLADYLIDQGKQVVIVDDLSGGYETNLPKRAIFHKADITKNHQIESLFEGYDFEAVYHLAAYAAEGLSHFIRNYNYQNNLIGSVNLINNAVKYDVPKFLFTSSMAVYGTQVPPFNEGLQRLPEDPYGIAKAAVERDLEVAHEMWGLDYTIIRPHNVYGPRQNIADPYRNVIGIFINRIMRGESPLIYGDGEQTRAFSYIDDVVPCIAKAPYVPEANGEIINVGAAEPYTINELANVVLEVMGSDLQPVHVQERKEVKHAHCTIDKSVDLLDYKTTVSLREGVERMAQWAVETGPQPRQTWDQYEVYKNIPDFWLNLTE